MSAREYSCDDRDMHKRDLVDLRHTIARQRQSRHDYYDDHRSTVDIGPYDHRESIKKDTHIKRESSQDKRVFIDIDEPDDFYVRHGKRRRHGRDTESRRGEGNIISSITPGFYVQNAVKRLFLYSG